jgi:hypothetical protein
VLCLCILTAAFAAASGASADHLVVRLDALSLSAEQTRRDGEARSPVPGTAEPTTLRLPLVTATDGTVAISLRQRDLDAALANRAGRPNVRLRLLQTATGAVTEDDKGELAVGMNTALVFEDLDTGTSKAFDIEIRGAIDADGAYGDDMPIHIEGWRRAEDGRPVANRTKENRSFWGTVPGRFEP